MMIRNRQKPNRLYLEQGDEDIFLENCHAQQHHVDGIRFLYRQYKRKQPGVVINDPFSFGRNIQIILFLKAIRSLLKKPVLIVCEEGDQFDWLDRFNTWSDLSSEVDIATPLPVLKKFIIMNPMVNIPIYSLHEWSILIVDGGRIHNPQQVLQLQFKADFKIWITPVNLRENLDMFEKIYNWLNPNEIFDKTYFIPNADNPVDIIDKTILLDSFMEDILIRRDVILSSLEKYQRDNIKPVTPMDESTETTVNPTATSLSTAIAAASSTAPPAPVSKKNKDATGTKIKRSKKRQDTETIPFPREPPPPPPPLPEETQQSVPIAASFLKLISGTPKTQEPEDSNEDFSIDNYKRKIAGANESQMIDIDKSEQQSTSQSHKPNVIGKPAEQKLEEMDTIVFANDTFICKVSDNTLDRFKIAEKQLTQNIVTCKRLNEQSTSYSITKDIPSSASGTSYIIPQLSDIEREKKNDGRCILPKKRKFSLDTFCTDTSEEQTKINIEALNKGISDLDTSDPTEVEYSQNKNEHTQSGSAQPVSEVKTNKIIPQACYSGARDTEQVANSLKRNNIDDMVKECEEKVSKKFKGSVLDSLF